MNFNASASVAICSPPQEDKIVLNSISCKLQLDSEKHKSWTTYPECLTKTPRRRSTLEVIPEVDEERRALFLQVCAPHRWKKLQEAQLLVDDKVPTIVQQVAEYCLEEPTFPSDKTKTSNKKRNTNEKKKVKKAGKNQEASSKFNQSEPAPFSPLIFTSDCLWSVAQPTKLIKPVTWKWQQLPFLPAIQKPCSLSSLCIIRIPQDGDIYEVSLDGEIVDMEGAEDLLDLIEHLLVDNEADSWSFVIDDQTDCDSFFFKKQHHHYKGWSIQAPLFRALSKHVIAEDKKKHWFQGNH